MSEQQPIKDRPTVTSDWESLQQPIQGVTLKWVRPVIDERGEICEVYRPSWGLHPAPLSFIYQCTIRPGVIKGWVLHERQDDRIFTSLGVMQWVLYDAREDSPTHGVVNEFNLGERSRATFVIPSGVYHAVRNVGTGDAVFINTPTREYEHGNPDKLRLPLENDLIPYRFRPLKGA